MNIVFNPYFDPQLLPDIGRGEVCFGTRTVGVAGLLDDMAMRIGLGFRTSPDSARVTALVERLHSYRTERIWSRSFAIDPTGVAKALISWRDTLLMAGWACRKGISARLDDLADISADILPGAADAWLALVASLEGGCPKPYGSGDRITYAVPEDLACPVVRKAIDLSGADVSYYSTPHPCAERRETLYSAACLSDSYEWAAAQDFAGATVINSDNRRLNCVLRHHGRPEVSSHADTGIPAPVHALRMGLSLFERPLNVHVLLAYLQCPACPVSALSRRALAGALASDGGFGDNWEKAMEEVPAGDTSVSEFLLPLIGNPDAEPLSGTESAAVAAYLASMEKWAAERMRRMPEEDRGSYFRMAELCRTLSSHMSAGGAEVSATELGELVNGICMSGEPATEKAMTGSFRTVSTPLALDSAPEKAVWLDCCGDGAAFYPYGFLTADETERLAAAGTAPLARERFSRLVQDAVSGILGAVKELTLVCPSHDRGDILTEHPVATALKSSGRVSTALPLPADSGENATFSPALELDLGIDIQGEFERTDSQSSIEKLIEFPFDYVTDYMLRMRDSAELQLSDIKITKGLVAHLFVENLVRDCREDAGRMATLLDTEFDARFRDAIRRKGLILNLKENRTEMLTFRHTLMESVRTLIGILRANGLTPVECEAKFDEDFALDDPIGLFGGSIDFVTRTVGGSLVIIDFKWSESSYYKGKLETDTSIQLELYRAAAEKKYGEAVTAVGYYLFPKMTLFTCDGLVGDNVHKVSRTPGAAPLMDMIGNSVTFRKDQFREGTVEMAEGLDPDDTRYSTDGPTAMVPLPARNGVKTSPLASGAERTPHQILKDMLK